MTVVGTRPEIIRLSATIKLLDKYTNQILVHTGQNYDYELNQIFFDDLDLRPPDQFMNADTSSLGATIGDIFKKTEEILESEKPDALLVLGDTNSCLSAYMAKRKHIPVFHMEAGNRSFDYNVPEEINRKVIDHIADYNLVYTEHARRHLLTEGILHRRIYLTGSPMKEVLELHKGKINKSKILEKLDLQSKGYFIVSVHREENVDNPINLDKILTVLNSLAEHYDLPVIISTHPRTRNRIESHENGGNRHPHLRFLKPFGFSDYISLQVNSLCSISDSGTISEESAILDFPAISIRESMERPEAQDAGSIILSGLDSERVLDSISCVIEEFQNKNRIPNIPQDYSIENTSWRVLKLILGNSKLSNKWWGIPEDN